MSLSFKEQLQSKWQEIVLSRLRAQHALESKTRLRTPPSLERLRQIASAG